ncbi:protease modulator HflC [Chromohalobacter salexigens]|uniref:Protein HflC n=1 Tax=Chromohalobacter moromii TaxID=2860329 RepID=A0A9X2WZZ9_9GAMM|nr:MULTISPECIES: protease modulator HflC [Chromohalobacter]MCK2044753.1 protease modulator HflC [Chromohalobacter moromii]MCT8504093.1 protease modulator HflC [Chromohalobacter moromii]NWO11020.1 protease modulator HflC [Chromohalobacter salexigens]CDQ33216.1 Modulator of FtsH protease HflC [Virgibacillus halodenitrificans]
MVNNRALGIVALLAVGAWIASSSLYVVTEKQRAIKLRFGEVVQADIEPGLHVKWPVLNTVRFFDARVQMLESTESRFLTARRNALIVDSYVKWQVVDPSLFYQATRGEVSRAEGLIAPRVDESLRNAFGSREVDKIISEERNEMLEEPQKQLDKRLREEVGVSILDIRLKRVELPQEVQQAVFQRMRTERNAEARQYRAQGQEQAERIRARADRERQVTLANARKKAETLRGEGDAKAAEIYANAYKQDEDFFDFYRSLQAYRNSFDKGDDMLLLSPDSEFFRYFRSPNGEASSNDE